MPWIDRIVAGESYVLFAGRPVAYERTSGSSGAAKLIPYSAEGLLDFQRSVAPWLVRTVREHGIIGRRGLVPVRLAKHAVSLVSR